MKIKIKQSTEREIEITFPSYYKSLKEYSSTNYYAFLSEKLSLFLTNGFTYITNIGFIDFTNLVPCDKSEVDEMFISNQKLFSSIMNPVTLDDNLPTEQLEKL